MPAYLPVVLFLHYPIPEEESLTTHQSPEDKFYDRGQKHTSSNGHSAQSIQTIEIDLPIEFHSVLEKRATSEIVRRFLHNFIGRGWSLSNSATWRFTHIVSALMFVRWQKGFGVQVLDIILIFRVSMKGSRESSPACVLGGRGCTTWLRFARGLAACKCACIFDWPRRFRHRFTRLILKVRFHYFLRKAIFLFR